MSDVTVDESKITRVTVVDKERGIVIEKWNQRVWVDVQDDGRTLKIYIKPRALGGEASQAVRDRREPLAAEHEHQWERVSSMTSQPRYICKVLHCHESYSDAAPY